jgi:hypothetical protein
VSHAAASRIYIPESAQVARTMLDQLRGAHHALLMEIANMESLTLERRLDTGRCMAGRWKISQASLARRMLSARICDYFLARCSLPDTDHLLDLRSADRELVGRSANHVATWSAQAISGDWRGYCAASRDIRARMNEHIVREQRALYPLLERSAEPANRHGNGASDGTRTRDLRRDRPAL